MHVTKKISYQKGSKNTEKNNDFNFMHKYLFVLGREWKLSVAEVLSIFGNDYEVITSEILCKNFAEKFEDAQKILDDMGGIIKIAEVFDKADNLQDAEEKIKKYLSDNFKSKCIFALSLYNIPSGPKKLLKKMLKKIKNALRDKGKVRFLNKPDENIRSVVVASENLHKKGTDVLIFKSGNDYLLAKTVAVQNFKKYSVRDYDRPCRDAKSGMLPPKLAQIMINLACEGKKKQLIYDPFCGSGTVLMEGLLMDHSVIGSDINKKAISDSEKNLKWLADKFGGDKTLIRNLFVKDAIEISKQDYELFPDCVVTETYLGPPLFRIPSKKEIDENFNQIRSLILKFLKRIDPLIKKEGTIVIAVPFYQHGNKTHHIENLVEKVRELGYDVSDLFMGDERVSLLYSRRNQVVGREIFKFTVPG